MFVTSYFSVWLDARTSKVVDELIQKKGLPSADAVAQISGLPLSTYFSSVKLKWLINNVPTVKEAINNGRCMAGTVDSWIIWVIYSKLIAWGNKSVINFNLK